MPCAFPSRSRSDHRHFDMGPLKYGWVRSARQRACLIQPFFQEGEDGGVL